MWLVRWIRLFFGTVSFKGQGGFLSRFVNLCHQKRIPLWDLEINGSELSAQTSVNGYKRLRQSARKSGVRVHAVEKSGIPFLLHKNRARIGLVAGLFLSVALYAVCSQCLWRIEVNGNRTVRAEAILAAAQASGVSRGAWKHNVDVSAAEIAVRRSIPEISWVAVNLRGSTAVIEVREQVEAPPTGERPPHRQKGDRRRHVRRRVVVPGRIECIPIGRTPYLMIEKPLRHEQQRDNRQGTAGAGDDDLSLINSSHARGSLSNQRRSP